MRAFLYSLILLSPVCVFPQAWFRMADWPGTIRDDGVAVVVNSKAYFGSGIDPVGETTDFNALDLASESWSPIQSMPAGSQRQYAIAFTGTNSFYISCGYTAGNGLNTTWRYNISNDSWTQVASKPGQGLIAAQCMQFGNKVIIAGGKFQDETVNREVWEYDLNADLWTKKADFPFVPVYRGSATVAGNKGYLLCGIDSASRFTKVLYEYDPNSDTWAVLSNLPAQRGRAYTAMAALNNRLFLFGGMDSLWTYYADSWYYDIGSGNWHAGVDIPAIERRGGMSCASNGNFYYSCGLSAEGRLKETWKIDIPLSVKSLNTDQNLVLYPNPAKNFLSIKNADQNFQDSQYRIYDSFGQCVLSGTFQNSEDISIALLTTGLYFLTIDFNGKVYSKRFVKE